MPAFAAGPTATFVKTSDWGSGWEGKYTITNGGTTTISSWTVAFDLPAGTHGRHVLGRADDLVGPAVHVHQPVLERHAGAGRVGVVRVHRQRCGQPGQLHPERRGLRRRHHATPPTTDRTTRRPPTTPRRPPHRRPPAADHATTTGPPPNTGLPKHALIGYLHASFANGSGYLRMADVPADWDIINLAFGEPTSVTSGDIRFRAVPGRRVPRRGDRGRSSSPPSGPSRPQGKKVLHLHRRRRTARSSSPRPAARDTFVSSVSAIIDRYGLDGLDIDFEGHSLSLNTGDTDFRNPTTPVIVNLISALRTLKSALRRGLRAHHGAGDVLRAARLPVLRLRPVRRPGPAGRLLPAGHLRDAQRPDRAARAGLQLRARSWGWTTSTTPWAAPTSTSR